MQRLNVLNPQQAWLEIVVDVDVRMELKFPLIGATTMILTTGAFCRRVLSDYAHRLVRLVTTTEHKIREREQV